MVYQQFLKRKNHIEKHGCEECLRKYRIDVNIEELSITETNGGEESLMNSEIRSELNYLNLSGCFQVTDLSIKYVCEAIFKFLFLHFSHSFKAISSQHLTLTNYAL